MIKHILFLFIILPSICQAQSIRVSSNPISHIITPYIIIFNGESNSQGKVPNTSLTTNEKSVRSKVQILNNNTLLLESLHIGVNNIIGWDAGTCCTTSGWETGVENNVDSATLPLPFYLVKTGEGSATIAQLDSNNSSGYYDTLNKRLAPIITQVTALNSGVAPQLFMWYTQGINDDGTGVDTTTWKARTLAYFARVRARYGFMPIIMTYIPPAHTNYNLAISHLPSLVSDLYLIPVSDLSTIDGAHWDYASMKIIAQRMISQLKLLGR